LVVYRAYLAEQKGDTSASTSATSFLEPGILGEVAYKSNHTTSVSAIVGGADRVLREDHRQIEAEAVEKLKDLLPERTSQSEWTSITSRRTSCQRGGRRTSTRWTTSRGFRGDDDDADTTDAVGRTSAGEGTWVSDAFEFAKIVEALPSGADWYGRAGKA
jgi:hypothetical protein